MSNSIFLTAEEAAEIMMVSKSYAYKVMRQLNRELEEQGYITISGRINRQYFLDRVCYGAGIKEKKEEKNGCI